MSAPSWARTYLDAINGSGFTFLSTRPNWEYNLIGGGKKWKFTSEVNEQSWYSYNSNGIDAWDETSLIGCTVKSSTNDTIDDIHITENNGTYSVQLAVGNYDGSSEKFFSVGNNYRNTGGLRSDNQLLDDFSDGSGSWLTLNNSGTGEQVFTWLSKRVRNANIYVNNDLWSEAGGSSYEWESVASIDEKSLSTLNDVNNGEAITTQDATKVTLVNGSNVGKIITDKINNW